MSLSLSQHLSQAPWVVDIKDLKEVLTSETDPFLSNLMSIEVADYLAIQTANIDQVFPQNWYPLLPMTSQHLFPQNGGDSQPINLRSLNVGDWAYPQFPSFGNSSVTSPEVIPIFVLLDVHWTVQIFFKSAANFWNVVEIDSLERNTHSITELRCQRVFRGLIEPTFTAVAASESRLSIHKACRYGEPQTKNRCGLRSLWAWFRTIDSMPNCVEEVYTLCSSKTMLAQSPYESLDDFQSIAIHVASKCLIHNLTRSERAIYVEDLLERYESSSDELKSAHSSILKAVEELLANCQKTCNNSQAAFINVMPTQIKSSQLAINDFWTARRRPSSEISDFSSPKSWLRTSSSSKTPSTRKSGSSELSSRKKRSKVNRLEKQKNTLKIYFSTRTELISSSPCRLGDVSHNCEEYPLVQQLRIQQCAILDSNSNHDRSSSFEQLPNAMLQSQETFNCQLEPIAPIFNPSYEMYVNHLVYNALRSCVMLTFTKNSSKQY